MMSQSVTLQVGGTLEGLRARGTNEAPSASLVVDVVPVPVQRGGGGESSIAVATIHAGTFFLSLARRFFLISPSHAVRDIRENIVVHLKVGVSKKQTAS